jgi:hypothetical protein
MSGLSANLDDQYKAWIYSVEQNMQIDKTFIKKWFPLAAAYQKRYLARRAIQARNPLTALKLIHQALIMSPRILFEEPKRTLVTLACAMLCALPEKLYNTLENIGINTQKQFAR